MVSQCMQDISEQFLCMAKW